MYTRSVPPANIDTEGLVKWLLLELDAVEKALAEQDEEVTRMKEIVNGL